MSLFLLSCSDSLSLLSENEPYKIESFSQGSFILENETLTAKIITDNSVSTTDNLDLVTELTNSQDMVIDTVKINDVSTNETVYFDEYFSDLDDGVYRINFLLYEEDEIVFKDSVPVFLQNEAFDEILLFSYSQEVYPGSYTIIQMEMDSANEEDPYVIWMSDNEVINEGYYSDGLSELVWKSPAEFGIYEIAAFFYPEKPLNETFIASPFSASLNIFVTDQISLSKHELDNSDSGYKKLFHFMGNVRNQISDSDIIWDGEFLPALSKNILGISAFNDSLVLNESLIPLSNGYIIPFSIALNFKPGTFLEPSVLFLTDLKGENGLEIELKRSAMNLYSLTLFSGLTETVIDFTIESTGNAYEELLFSYVPEEESSVISLFLNSYLIDKVESPVLVGPFIQGESKLGSMNDQSVFHELGVYSKEGVYGFSILSPVNNENSANLFYDNFESMNGDKYLLSDKSISFQSGSVTLPPDSNLVMELPDFTDIDNFNISVLSDSSVSLYINETLLQDDDEKVYRISVYDTVFHNTEEKDILRNETNYLSIGNHTEKEIIINELKISQ